MLWRTLWLTIIGMAMAAMIITNTITIMPMIITATAIIIMDIITDITIMGIIMFTATATGPV